MSEEVVFMKGTETAPILLATEYLDAHLEKYNGQISKRLGQFPRADLDAKNIQLDLTIEFMTLNLGAKQVSFYSLVSIHEEEMNLAVAQGVVALSDLFEANDVTDICDFGRRNFC